MKHEKYTQCLKDLKGKVKGKGNIQKMCSLPIIDIGELQLRKKYAPLLLISERKYISEKLEPKVENIYKIYGNAQHEEHRLNDDIKKYNGGVMMYRKYPHYIELDKLSTLKSDYNHIMKKDKEIAKKHKKIWNELERLGLADTLKNVQKKNRKGWKKT